MTIPARVSPDLLPAISLTLLLRDSRVRAAWEARLPGTDEVLKTINPSANTLRIPPSDWTRDERAYATIGAAFDYAVGALWAKESLSPVFQRVDRATHPNPALSALIHALAQLLLLELPGWLAEGALTPAQRDAFRGLGLLAQLDAVYRAGADAPAWTHELSDTPLSQATLAQRLRRYYPDAFTDELIALVRAALTDLPQGAQVFYDPNFGSPPGLEHIRADGDLLVDDTLIELKVSLQPFAREHLWQLLGYVALDRLHGRHNVQRVALYNPRFRRLWSESAHELSARLGRCSLEEFCAWFRDTPAAHAARTAQPNLP